MEFTPFQKVPRLSRDIIITEKLDGTNASIWIQPISGEPVPPGTWEAGGFHIASGSRNRWITPDDDNYGFAKWVRANAEELVGLGPGHHFGEWWGNGIQRGYGLAEKRFSLFNVQRWAENDHCVLDGQERPPECCEVVPVMYRGKFGDLGIKKAMDDLAYIGSFAAPGFMDPEGIIIFHTAAGNLFKKTIKGDEVGKSQEQHTKKAREPRPPKNPAIGGRRKEQRPIDFEDRRMK